MSNETYQGWTNYETWHAYWDIIDGYAKMLHYEGLTEPFDDVDSLADHFGRHLVDVVNDNNIATDAYMFEYTADFIDKINFYEIAVDVALNYPEFTKNYPCTNGTESLYVRIWTGASTGSIV